MEHLQAAECQRSLISGMRLIFHSQLAPLEPVCFSYAFIQYRSQFEDCFQQVTEIVLVKTSVYKDVPFRKIFFFEYAACLSLYSLLNLERLEKNLRNNLLVSLFSFLHCFINLLRFIPVTFI